MFPWYKLQHTTVSIVDMCKKIFLQNAGNFLPLTVKKPSLIPRPLPDFISQLWRRIRRRPGIIATSWAGNGGLG